MMDHSLFRGTTTSEFYSQEQIKTMWVSYNAVASLKLYSGTSSNLAAGSEVEIHGVK